MQHQNGPQPQASGHATRDGRIVAEHRLRFDAHAPGRRARRLPPELRQAVRGAALQSRRFRPGHLRADRRDGPRKLRARGAASCYGLMGRITSRVSDPAAADLARDLRKPAFLRRRRRLHIRQSPVEDLSTAVRSGRRDIRLSTPLRQAATSALLRSSVATRFGTGTVHRSASWPRSRVRPARPDWTRQPSSGCPTRRRFRTRPPPCRVASSGR